MWPNRQTFTYFSRFGQMLVDLERFGKIEPIGAKMGSGATVGQAEIAGGPDSCPLLPCTFTD